MKLLLPIIFPLVAFHSSAQTKIGNITIDDKTAQAFFLYCYNNPDTIPKTGLFDTRDASIGSYSFSAEEGRIERQRVAAFNEHLKSIAIREIFDTVRYESGYDTLYNYSPMIVLGCTGCSSEHIVTYNNKERTKEIKSGIKSITFRPYQEWSLSTGKYLVPKTPTEQLFIKWMATIKNTNL